MRILPNVNVRLFLCALVFITRCCSFVAIKVPMNEHTQGLSQDFKTACPTQQRFQNDPFNPFWESVIILFTLPIAAFVNLEEFCDVVHHKKEMEVHMIGANDCTLLRPIKLCTRIHTF